MAGKAEYPLKTAGDVLVIMRYLRDKGIRCEWSGICVWLEGTFPPAAERNLEKLGARWARKRGQWFFRAAEGIVLEEAAA